MTNPDNDLHDKSQELGRLLSDTLGDDYQQLDDLAKNTLLGVGLSAAMQSKSGSDYVNPFNANSIHAKAFKVSFDSIPPDITIPSAAELRWLDAGKIARLFRKLTLDDISVHRHGDSALVFVGTLIDIDVINVICQETYSDALKIYKPIMSEKCALRCLLISFG